MEKQRFIRLKVENFERLTSVDIALDGNVVFVGGLNRQGKTSLLNAVACLTGGAGDTPEEPVHTGAKKSVIIGETQDFVIKKTITAKNVKHTVEPKDGRILTKAIGGWLKDLTGNEKTSDLMDFFSLKGKAQLETLKSILGLDFTALDEERTAVYNRRTQSNSLVRRAQAELDSCSSHPDTPDVEVSVADLVEELQNAEIKNAENDQKRQQLEAMRDGARALQGTIRDLEEKLTQANDNLASVGIEGANLKGEVSELVDADVESVRAKFTSVEQTNKKVRDNSRHKELKTELDEHTIQSEAYTERIAEIDSEKAAKVASADMPVPGLSFDDERVLLNDLPLDQASQFERIRTGVALKLAKNPTLPVLLVKDGSAIDKPNRELTAQMVMSEKAQIFIEVVGDEKIEGEGVCQIIIDDGKGR